MAGAEQGHASQRGATEHIERALAPPPAPEEIFEASEADAAYNIGVKYYNYYSDDKKLYDHLAYAVKWFRRAAKLGSADAQYRLGVAYEWGESLEVDYAEALKWYQLAAEQMNKGGQYGLGGLYANGRGVDRDYAEAAKWYKLSAVQGKYQAQYELGLLFFEGKGERQSFEKAYFWLALASKELDEAMEKRDEAAKHLTEEKLEVLRSHLKDWKPGLPASVLD